MDAQEVMHMTDYSKITALYSRLSVGDEDRDGGESNSIQNQKIFLENYAKGQHLTNIRHYIDDDESGRFFDRSAYSRMIEDVESGKIGVCIMKDLTDLTPAILNEFISRIEVHERDQKRARYAIQHISIYFNYIGKFENEVTQLAEPTEQEIRQMREEIEEAKKEKSRAYHRQYSREYRARNLEKQREYDRMKAREYRARRKAQAAAAQPAQ